MSELDVLNTNFFVAGGGGAEEEEEEEKEEEEERESCCRRCFALRAKASRTTRADIFLKKSLLFIDVFVGKLPNNKKKKWFDIDAQRVVVCRCGAVRDDSIIIAKNSSSLSSKEEK
jgi:hypothetical protein